MIELAMMPGASHRHVCHRQRFLPGASRDIVDDLSPFQAA
jgi:hypothetical protein